MEINSNLFSEFKTNFKAYILNCYESVSKESEIAGFGIFTDSDMSTFVVHINTTKHLSEQHKNKTSEDEKLTDKWWLPEWGWVSKYQTDEKNLHNNLEHIYINMEFVAYKKNLFRVYCEVLSELFKEEKLKNTSDDFILMVQECDNFNQEKDKESLSMILGEKQWEEYIKFNKYWMAY
jgi:hypothetical protein